MNFFFKVKNIVPLEKKSLFLQNSHSQFLNSNGRVNVLKYTNRRLNSSITTICRLMFVAFSIEKRGSTDGTKLPNHRKEFS